MKNRDTILLEEAYNKTRLLKEESMTREGERVVRDVDRFNREKTKEDRMYRQVQQATDQSETEIAPKLGDTMVDIFYSIHQKMEKGSVKDELYDAIIELVDIVKRAKDNADLPEVLETLVDQIGVDIK